MDWHLNKFAQFAETTSKIMACAALFSIVLPTALPNIFLALFLIFLIIGGNFKFKFELIITNSIALLCIGIFLLFVFGLIYTSASIEEALSMLKKYSKFMYVPLLLCAFHEQRWKKIGYISFVSGVTLMMFLSYMTLFGWQPESIYAGAYTGPAYDKYIVFRSRIAHATLVAFMAYLFIQHAIVNEHKLLKLSFVVLAILASINVLVMVPSRSGQVLWTTLMLLLIYQYFGWRRFILGLLIVPVLTIGILVSSDTTRIRIVELKNDIEQIQERDYRTSLGYRVIWAQGAWDIFKHNPIFGTGTGSFETEFKKYIDIQDIKNTPYRLYSKNPHNGYVSIGVQLGIVGLIFLIMLFIQQWRVSYMLSIFGGYVAKGFIITVVVSNLMNSFIFSHTQGIFFAIFTALLFSAYLPKNIKQE